MAIINNDNIDTRAPKAQDNRHGKFASGLWKPFDTVAEALSTVTTYRHEGLTLPIRRSTDKIDLYWFQGGITNSNFVLYKPEVALLDYYTKAEVNALLAPINTSITTLTSTAQNIQTELDNHEARVDNPHSVTKTQVGLSNVDNTSDLNKPLSTATITALLGKEDTLPTGTALQYFKGDKTLGTLDKTAVGLPNVDNTSDVNKPVSTAQQSALDLKANINSPSLTGVPLAPTAAPGTNTTQLATTAFVTAAITGASTNLQGVTNTGNDTTNAIWFTGFSNQGVIRKGLIIGEGGLTQYNPIAFPSAPKIWDLTYDGSTNVSLNYFDGGTDGATIYLTNQSPSVAGVQLREPGTSNINRRIAIGNGINLNEAVNLSQLNGKQNTLISGTNIKTINGITLLGSGNISITSTTPDATTTVKGIVKLAGDLAGTADIPTVPALATKAPINSPTFTGTVGGITKFMINLGNVDNTADIDKPISTATQTALDLKANVSSLSLYQLLSEKNQANGYVGLDGTTKIPAIYLPSYVDDILEFANLASFPVTGETEKVYVALDTNKIYRWSGSTYVEVSPSDVNSVNGLTGIINLSTTNIPEGTNEYYTTAKVNGVVDPKLATGQTIGANTTGNAATVTNGVVTTGSYANPSWITALAYAKITGVPDFALNTDVIHTTLNEVKNGRLTLNTPNGADGTSPGTSVTPLLVQGGNGGTNTATSGFALGGTATTITIRGGNGGGSFSSSGTRFGGTGAGVDVIGGDAGQAGLSGGTAGTAGSVNLQAGSVGSGSTNSGFAGKAFIKGGQNNIATGLGGSIYLVPGYGDNNSSGSNANLTYDGNVFLGVNDNGNKRGAIIIGSGTSDTLNILQVTGNSKFTGKLVTTDTALIGTVTPEASAKLHVDGKIVWGTGTNVAGVSSIYNTSSSGTILRPITGSVTDFVLMNGSNQIVMSLEPGAIGKQVTFTGGVRIGGTVASNVDTKLFISNATSAATWAMSSGVIGGSEADFGLYAWTDGSNDPAIVVKAVDTINNIYYTGIGIKNPTVELDVFGVGSFTGNVRTNTSFISNRANALVKGVFSQTGGLNRWFSGGNAASESGSNAGTNFVIERYNDAGTVIDVPLSISRSSGTVTLANTLLAPSATFSGSVTLANGLVTGAAGVNRGYYLQTGSNFRWGIVENNVAESGSNVGSDFNINRYDDAGTVIGTVLSLIRSTGNATFSGTVNATQGTFISGGPAIRGRSSTGTGNIYVEFQNNIGTRLGYVGCPSAANNNMAITADLGSIAYNGSSHAFSSNMTGTTAQFTGNVDSQGAFVINRAGAVAKGIFSQTSASSRWFFGANATSESGSNLGTNFIIERYSDAGASLGNALTIERNTGNASFSGNVISSAVPTIGSHLTNKTYTDGLLAAGLGVNTVSAAASLTLSARGYYTFNGTTTTWTLPALAGATGTLYRIINMGSGNLTLSAGTNEIYDSGASSTTFIVGATISLSLYNNGIKWVILG